MSSTIYSVGIGEGLMQADTIYVGAKYNFGLVASIEVEEVRNKYGFPMVYVYDKDDNLIYQLMGGQISISLKPDQVIKDNAISNLDYPF